MIIILNIENPNSSNIQANTISINDKSNNIKGNYDSNFKKLTFNFSNLNLIIDELKEIIFNY